MIWRILDTALHRLKLHIPYVCDRYDLTLGMTRAELDR